MTQIVIHRTSQDATQTLGTFTMYVGAEKVFEGVTLELPWRENRKFVSCIPANHYSAIKHISPKFGKCLWIQSVPNRTDILMHRGNFHYEILGCILVGETHKDIDGDSHKDVTNSKTTIEKIYDLAKEPIFVNIFDPVSNSNVE